MPHTVVQFARHLPVGDALYRETWPMQALGAVPEFQVIDIHYQSPYRYQLAFQAELLVVGVLLEPELVPILRWRQAKGKPTILDLQNHILAVDPWTPTFEMRNDPVTRVPFLYLTRLVDLVQTTTPFLAREFQPYCSRVAVFPNELPDEAIPSGLPQKKERPLVIGWGGSPSHLLDVACIAPAVAKWIANREDTELWVMGAQSVADLFDLPPEKKRFIHWGDMNAYNEFLDAVHIGLAPLHDSPFNRARSDVKWLEYAAHGCVFVGQRIQVYTDSVEEGRTGFLFDDAGELVSILEKLYEDGELMEWVRQAAFDHVTTHRRYTDHIRARADAYEELLAQPPVQGRETWNLHKVTRSPSMELPDPLPGYLPVTLPSDEQKVLDALYNRAPNVPDEAIRFVEERYGEHHLTCYARAMLASRQGDQSSADDHLVRSLSFYPGAVESMVLRGRLLSSMGRHIEARNVLAEAVEWNPVFMAGYSYLLNVLQQQSDWQAALDVADDWVDHCGRDPRVHMVRSRLLVQAGRTAEGIQAISEAMDRFGEEFDYWQRPFAAELVRALRELDESVSDDPQWQDLIVSAAEAFPHGMWLAARAGAICFRRGEHDRGARLLQAARDRLVDWEWQALEASGNPKEYRGTIEMYRAACELLRRSPPSDAGQPKQET